MAIAPVQSAEKNAGGVASTTLAYGSAVTAGSTLIATTSASTEPVNIHADGNGNTWVIGQSQVQATQFGVRSDYVLSANAGATTVTSDPSGTADVWVCISEWSGITTYDSAADGGSSGSSSAPSAGATGTLADATSLVYAAMAHFGTNQTITEDTADSFTMLQEHEGGSSDMPGAVQYKIVSATTSVTPDWATGSSQNWLAHRIVFGGSTPPTTVGPVFPTAASAVAAAPESIAWAGAVTNVFSDNGVEATVTAATFDAGAISQQLRAVTFDFSAIPDGSTIDGIFVEIERRTIVGATGAVDNRVQLQTSDGVFVGDNKASATAWPTTATVAGYGGLADTWNASLTTAQVKASTFGVVLSVEATAANTDIGVDFIRMTIAYTEVTGTDANAEAAEGTATANQSAASVAPNAQAAEPAAVANNAAPGVSPAAQTAEPAATANNATTTVSSTPATAEPAAVANQPAASVTVNAEVAEVGAVAFDATVSAAPSTNAPAETAEATATANQAASSIAPTAASAEATATANNAAPGVATNAQTAEVGAAAFDATVVVAPTVSAPAETAEAAATANPSTAGVAPTPATAEPAAVANQPAARVAVNVENAAVGAAALDATVSTATQVFANAQAAEVGATANQSAATVATTAATAEPTATAEPLSARVTVNAELAAASGVANDATVMFGKDVFPATAEAGVAANDVSAAVAVAAEFAAIIAEAFNAEVPPPFVLGTATSVYVAAGASSTVTLVHSATSTLVAAGATSTVEP